VIKNRFLSFKNNLYKAKRIINESYFKRKNKSLPSILERDSIYFNPVIFFSRFLLGQRLSTYFPRYFKNPGLLKISPEDRFYRRNSSRGAPAPFDTIFRMLMRNLGGQEISLKFWTSLFHGTKSNGFCGGRLQREIAYILYGHWHPLLSGQRVAKNT